MTANNNDLFQQNQWGKTWDTPKFNRKTPVKMNSYWANIFIITKK